MRNAPPGQRNGCSICDTLPPGDLIELDSLMGDATRWPKTVWGIFPPPKGTLPPSYRRFGAMEMGINFLAEKGYTFTRQVVRRHLRYDVVVIPSDAGDLVAQGVIASSNEVKSFHPDSPIDPKAYLTYFNKGIVLGIRGLELMQARLEEMAKAGDPIPMATLKIIAELGAKLSITQATIRARGTRVEDDGDEDEGFRAGSAPLPSPRLGHARIRRIDGVTRPVKDEGPADRDRYSERAVMDGGSGLPHR